MQRVALSAIQDEYLPTFTESPRLNQQETEEDDEQTGDLETSAEL